tara:strand:- start:819 stop:1031 length:213 start_codon:yes stop_codon:yes gene_type:complete
MDVKKSDQDTSLFEKELNNQNLYSESFKTTNVNVLLNRVRLDKKKSFRKKIVISLAVTSIFIAIITYFLI